MWTFLAKWFSRGSFQKIFSIYSFVKIWPTVQLWPHPTSLDHDLNLHYLRKLSIKLQLYRPNGIWEDFLKLTYHFLITSPLRGAWLFIRIILNPLVPGKLLPSLVEIGSLVMEKMKIRKVYNKHYNANCEQQTNLYLILWIRRAKNKISACLGQT